jgi:dienelactone hydrolase
LTAEQFEAFQRDIRGELAKTLQLEKWVVRLPQGKNSPIATLFEDRLIKSTQLHGVTIEIHTVTIQPTGLVVPMVVCLPKDQADTPIPGVCVFSGHSTHGLHDLVVNLDSYQQAVAVRLAQAGIASIAVEKIDTGYLSRNGATGNDEDAAATLMLSWGHVLRSHQLSACLAATEILAGHARVDERRIGATGVSLGGWLAVQTALLNDRIKAVADFGRKTQSVPDETSAANLQPQRDLCHIIPGMFHQCDRNLMPVALAPLPMLAGHGSQDAGSHNEHAASFRKIGEAQYTAIGAAESYSYLIHDGGDTMPSVQVIKWFQQQFTVGD